MTARQQPAAKGRKIAVEFTPGELEIVADLVDCRLTAITPEDRNDDAVERRLQAVADRIKALGAVRPMLGTRDPIAPTRRGPRVPGARIGGAK
jgi:hypothetical protein